MAQQIEPKQSMKALKPFRYGKKDLRADDYFEAEASHARLLKAVGRAIPEERNLEEKAKLEVKPVERIVAPAARQLKENPAKPAAKKKAISKKASNGKYHRRDLRAED